VGTMLCCPSMMLALVAGYCRPTATSTNMKPVYGSAQAPAAAWFRTPVQALELGAVRQGLGGGPAQRQCHNANISRRALATLSSQPKSVCSLRRAAPVPEQVLALAQGHSAAAECTARAANGGSASTAVITHSPGGGRFGGRSCGPSGGLCDAWEGCPPRTAGRLSGGCHGATQGPGKARSVCTVIAPQPAAGQGAIP